MRDDKLIRPPNLPIAAARQVVRSLLLAELAKEVPAPIDDAAYVWRRDENNVVLMLRATELGLSRIAEGAPTATPSPSTSTDTDTLAIAAIASLDQAASAAPGPASTPQAPSRPSVRSGRQDGLRQAARALLAAWDGIADRGLACHVMEGPVRELRAALVSATLGAPVSPRPQGDTKEAQVVAMLSRNEGAGGPQIAAAMGWAPHTVRGFLAGLAKKGMNLHVLERVRQVGPNKTGAKGSYTVYHVASEARE
jgi:hypothetical protein